MCMTKEISVCIVLMAFISNGFTASVESRKAVKQSLENCEKSLSWTCLKMEFVKFLEKIADVKEVQILPGLSLVRDTNATDKQNTEIIAEIARSFPNDPDQRLNGFIFAKIKNFLYSHSMKIKLLEPKNFDNDALKFTGRKGKFGKKGGLEALVAAGIMMKGTLLAIGMGTLALIAGKALMTALMALTLSGVIGLKALASGGGKSTTYEIVAKPVYTSSHSHSVSHDEGHGHISAHGSSGYGGGGFGRSLNLELPDHLKGPE